MFSVDFFSFGYISGPEKKPNDAVFRRDQTSVVQNLYNI